MEKLRAFNTVNHDILLNKLNSFNVSEHSINWFRNYLTGRVQAVKTNNVTSDYKDINCGVPQGSILGTLLFITYINDMGKYLDRGNVSLYADDTALYVQARSQVEVMLDLRIELSLVYEWLKANKLTINAEKTKYIIFGKQTQIKNKLDLNLRIGNKKIGRVPHVKYLGVLVDESLTFREHINYIYTKSSKKLGILRKAREFLDRKTSILLYKSLIVPYSDYCDTTYMCGNAADLNSLQMIQNTVCRTILRMPKDTSIDLMHCELNFM